MHTRTKAEQVARRAALRLKRMSLAYRIMSTSAVKRANELLVLRHHDGSYQSRVCGTRYFPPIKE